MSLVISVKAALSSVLVPRKSARSLLLRHCSISTSATRSRQPFSAANPFLQSTNIINISRRTIATRTHPLPMTATSSSPSTTSNSSNNRGEDILHALQQSRTNKNQQEQPFVGRNVALAMESLAKADAVCFDVDSTVIAEEGIDVLAEFLGQGEAVAALTKQAMEGSQKFQDALKARLNLMKPSRQAIEKCLQEKPFALTPGIEEFIEALTVKGIPVYFVSGGFRIMIEPVAMKVCVAKDRIYANTLLFDEDGNYAGFDPNEPTSADMGKPKALEIIKAKNNYQTMVMVGDGATDAQAKPPADAFIGFGGVVVRPAVQEAADWFVTDFEDMTTIVEQFTESKFKGSNES